MKTKEEKLKYGREYYRNNKDKISAYTKKYGIEHRKRYRERHNENQRKRNLKIRQAIVNGNPEIYALEGIRLIKINRAVNKKQNDKEYQKKYRKNNLHKRREFEKKKRNENVLYRLKTNIASRITSAFKYKKIKKSSRTEELLGVSFETAKKYIERQFTKGMNWNNHGRGDGKWQIDHVIPLATAKTEEELIKLFHYTNLQPLWAIDNLKKRDKIFPTQMKMNI